MKTSAKYYHLMVGAQGQVKLAKVAKKSSTYDITNIIYEAVFGPF